MTVRVVNSGLASSDIGSLLKYCRGLLRGISFLTATIRFVSGVLLPGLFV